MLDDVPLSMVVDTMAEGVVVFDAACRVVLWNRALEEMTGWTRAEMLGDDCTKVLGTATAGPGTPENACALLKVTDGQPAVAAVRCLLRARDGSEIPVLKNARVLPADGKSVGAVVTFTDLRPIDELRQALERTRESLEEVRPPGRLAGASAAMLEVYARIRLAAAADAAVLLLGETGTGKELVAEAIHESSARAGRPFVKVNCSALAESLLEAELFGHVRGAFTGAVQDKPGRFAAADGGTILLDEIGDISPLIQVKLLRVLQTHEFERVGEATPRRVDVRVICATHRDLRAMVREGTFREDLFYRIRVFPIELPPLRRRKTDIPALVETFIRRYAGQTGKAITGVAPQVLHCLMDYCWPGNVRELENAIEHAFVVCQGDTIELLDLPVELRQIELRSAYCREHGLRVGAAPTPMPPGAGTREALVELLEQCRWNQSEAARCLGVDRTTVWRRMKRLGILPPR